ncbi:MAG: spore germination protein [Clostridia bacterium]|nr:spore germination protein [Clostridia bacterium]
MKSTVTNRQIFFIIFLTLTGYSLISIPKDAVKSAGTGAWITVLLLTIGFMFGMFFIVSLNKKFEGKVLSEYSSLIVGKIMSKVITSIYSVYFLIISVFLFRAVSEFIKYNYLHLTPLFVITALILFVSAYNSYKGITNIGRICEIYGIIYVLVFIFMYITMLFLGDTKYIQPFFEKNEIKQYIFGVKDLIVPFLGIEILTMIPFGNVNTKKGRLYSLLSVLFVGVFYIMTIESSIAIIGINSIVNYDNALLEAMRETTIPGTFIPERIDFIFATVGIMGIICCLSIVFNTLSENVTKLLPRTNKNTIIIIISFVILILSGYIVNKDILKFLLNNIVPIYGIVVAFIIPIKLYIIAKVRKL